jgi:hypothetical protein
MGTVERATRAELRALEISEQTSGAGAALIAVAKHVDGAKGAAAAAARELRLGLAALRAGPSAPPLGA